MEEHITCKVCGSVVKRTDIDGLCKVCLKPTCKYCSRVCDGCQKIVCMKDIEASILKRQDQTFHLKFCTYCRMVKWQ